MAKGPLQLYRERVAAGEFEADEAQLAAAEKLDELAVALEGWRPRKGLLGFIARSTKPPRGIYIHGAVGRGKTMLMDLFHTSVAFEPKRRIHFHEFMAEVQDRIAAARKSQSGDPIPAVARRIAAETRLLCFDELHVTDIADAMILGRLFKGLFEERVIVVATSNTPPSDLYRNGLNRQLFLPFVDLIEDNLDVLELAAAKDFRLDKLAGRRLYFTPIDGTAHSEMERIWRHLTGGRAGQQAEIEVKGRKVLVPQTAMGVAWFRFADLCGKPLGALDYLHIARAFHTLLIECIPVLGPDRRAEARRLIHLIDTLYDHGVGLVVTAEAEPDALYVKGEGADLFKRTASRLIEMRSEAYLAGRRHNAASQSFSAN